MTTVAIFGAAGSMGTRLSARLRGNPKYKLLFVEGGEAGVKKIRDRGDVATDPDEALAQAEIIILAIPDNLIGKVAAQIVPKAQSGAMIMCLDPAAPYGGVLPSRDDITYFATHPAHPSVFNDEMNLEARRDYFGCGKAKQAIVCALMQGPEEDYAKGEALASDMFGPVLRSHRVTVEQMAYLEPALSETVGATCLTVIREAMDEAIAHGVPPAAARDFILGHINVNLAIFFGEIDWQISDGAKRAVADGKTQIFQPDWKKVFKPEELRRSVAKITGTASAEK